jgi:hypothetical protein
MKTVKNIPISAAENIAKKYGYDQIVIIARKVSDEEHEGGEAVTTYGINKAHCDIAAKIGNFIKYRIMQWEGEKNE